MTDFFISNKQKYKLHVSLGESSRNNCGITKKSTQSNIPLITEDILMLEWNNEMNRLYLSGYVEYEDNHGLIDRITEEQLTYLRIEFEREMQSSDGDIALQKYGESTLLEFMVDNIEIIRNDPGKIVYRIYIIGDNYFQLNKDAIYTNYGTQKSRKITDIIKDILTNSAKLAIDEVSFQTNASGVELDYITQNNDSVQSAIDFLMNRSFFDPNKGLEKSLKTLIYNENSGKIVLFDTSPNNSRLGTIKEPITIKVLQNDSDMINDIPVYMGYMKRESKIKSILNMQDINFHYYKWNTNDFTCNENEMTNSQIQQLYNGEDNNIPKMNLNIDKTYSKHQMEWNSFTNVYQETFKCLTQSNGLIINHFGYIGACPGYSCIIAIPNRYQIQNEDKNTDDFENLKYQMFTGRWDIFGVTNYISPRKMIYKQKLSLYRNRLNA